MYSNITKRNFSLKGSAIHIKLKVIIVGKTAFIYEPTIKFYDTSVFRVDGVQFSL